MANIMDRFSKFNPYVVSLDYNDIESQDDKFDVVSAKRIERYSIAVRLSALSDIFFALLTMFMGYDYTILSLPFIIVGYTGAKFFRERLVIFYLFFKIIDYLFKAYFFFNYRSYILFANLVYSFVSIFFTIKLCRLISICSGSTVRRNLSL